MVQRLYFPDSARRLPPDVQAWIQAVIDRLVGLGGDLTLGNFLAAVNQLTLAENEGIYATGPGSAATFDLTAFSRALLAEADAAGWLDRLGIHSAIPFHSPIAQNDQGIFLTASIATWPSAIYDSTANKTYFAWEAVTIRDNSVARIMAYDHADSTWSTIYDIDFWTLADDAHGQPSLTIDADGYVYAFYGSHLNDQPWAISKNPNDISSWNIQTVISGDYTYPKPNLVGSKIHLLLRETIAVSTKMPLVHYSGTPSGGTLTFGSKTTLVDFETDSKCYIGEVHVRGTDLHFLATKAFYADDERRDVFYFIYATATGGVRNLGGTITVPNASLPVDLATARASFRIVNTGSNRAEIPSLQFDTTGNAHILYTEGGNTTSYWLKHMYWNGLVLSTPEVLARLTDINPATEVIDTSALVAADDDEMQAYYIQNAETVRGGDIARRIWNPSTGAWGLPQTIVATGSAPLICPSAVARAHEDFRVTFHEVSDGVDYSADKKNLHAYALGDNGFISPPKVYEYQHLEDGDENLICGVDPNTDSIQDLSGNFSTGSTGEVTPQGGATVSAGKMSFDGTDDYVQVGDSAAWQLDVDFTIECRGVVLDTVAVDQIFVSHWNSTGNLRNFFFGYLSSANQLRFLQSSDGIVASTAAVSWTPVAGVGYDLAVERKEDVLRFFVNGTQQGSDTAWTLTSFNSSVPLRIGTAESGGVNVQHLDGLMAQCRITQKALFS